MRRPRRVCFLPPSLSTRGSPGSRPFLASSSFHSSCLFWQSSPGTWCTSWSCCRRGFTPAFTPSPPPSSSAKGWGQVARLKTSEASHRHKLGQSQTMEESKKSTNRGNLNFLKVPQTKRPSMRDLLDTEKNYFLEKCSIKENLSTTSGQNVFCLKPSTTENIFML